MKRIVLLAVAVAIATAGNTEAANFAVITSPPTILNLAIFLVAIACVVVGFKVFDLVRGGNLSKSWQVFIFAFVTLALAELAWLCDSFEIVSLPVYVTPAFLVLTVGLFLLGMLQTRKVLG